MTGNAASNFFYGEAGNDTLSGGDGDFDGLFGLEGATISSTGGPGGLRVLLPSEGVTVSLTTGTPIGEGSDTLANIEDVEGSRQDDRLTGDAGSNVFWPAPGNDSIDGSSGTDTVSHQFSQSAVTANLTTGTATGDGTDTLTGIENLDGSGLNDTLTGDAGPNVLIGHEGTDTLDGADGTDTCDGESEVNCEA
jgi:Ca2+-binding RTX toxin-like protein